MTLDRVDSLHPGMDKCKLALMEQLHALCRMLRQHDGRTSPMPSHRIAEPWSLGPRQSLSGATALIAFVPPNFDRQVLHFTHMENVRQIFTDGAIFADSVIAQAAREPIQCADQGIKARRRTMPVKVAPFGVVADYVPFYFAARSPMMYSIWRGNVRTYGRSADELVYFFTTVRLISESGISWVTSDGNCATLTTDHYNDWTHGEAAIDWNVMQARIWKDTDEDGDRKRRRSAELLVHRAFPVSLVSGIVVKNETVAREVRQWVPQDVGGWIVPDYYF